MSSALELEHLLRDTDAEIARLSRSMSDADGVSRFNMISLAKRRERLEEQLDENENQQQGIVSRRLLDASVYAPAMVAAGVAVVASLGAGSLALTAAIGVAQIGVGLVGAFMLRRGRERARRAYLARPKDSQQT